MNDTPVDDEFEPYRGQLVEAGLVDDEGRPLEFLRELIETLAAPALMVDVETCGPDGLVGHGAVVNSGQRGYVSMGWPHDAEVEYAPVQPQLLAAELAHMVAFHPAGTIGAGPWEVSAPLQLVEGTLTTLGTLDGSDHWTVAKGELPGIVEQRAPGMDEQHRQRLTDVLAAIELSWRVTVSWPDDSREAGRAARVLVVLDCGELGYWRRDLPEEPLYASDITADTSVRLVNADAATLWNDIGGLIPQRGE